MNAVPVLLEVDQLSVSLDVEGERRQVLRDVSLEIREGESLGLVGESGSGKSMTARAIDRLLPDGASLTGAVRFCGADVSTLVKGQLRDFRHQVAMIFQDPRAFINPVRNLGDFMTEALRTGSGVSKRDAEARAVAALAEVGIDDGGRRLRQYPHQLSGGLLQRVMIATALLTDPLLLLADEPTTALDVTTQAEVMAILTELRKRRGMAVLFITHNLELAAAVCDRTAVMYAGQLVEVSPSASLHTDPLHPYTAALGAARPDISSRAARLSAIPGQPLSSFDAPRGACAFAPRCSFREDRCVGQLPPMVEIGSGTSRCVRAFELRGRLARPVSGAPDAPKDVEHAR